MYNASSTTVPAMEALVRRYRFYPLDTFSSIAAFGSDVDCATDREACELARRMLGESGDAEVWQGTRYVAQVSAPKPGTERAT